MHISDKRTKENIAFQIKDRFICPVRKRQVVEFHEKACDKEQKNQDKRHSSKTEGQSKIQSSAADLSRSEMKKQASKNIKGFSTVYILF